MSQKYTAKNSNFLSQEKKVMRFSSYLTPSGELKVVLKGHEKPIKSPPSQKENSSFW